MTAPQIQKVGATTKTTAPVLQLAQAAEPMKEATRDYEEAKGIKIENCIGFTKVPLGLAGPLTIHGDYQTGAC